MRPGDRFGDSQLDAGVFQREDDVERIVSSFFASSRVAGWTRCFGSSRKGGEEDEEEEL